MKVKMIELFAGIGSQHQAMKNLGIDVDLLGISEIDKFALTAYEQLNGKINNYGDITKIDALPTCEIMTASFPCQDISIAGEQAGLNEGSGTRSSLLWHVERLVAQTKPTYLVVENVKNLVGKTHYHNFTKWLSRMEGLGYKNYWKVLNANSFGVPQNRERVFVVSILGNEPFTFDGGFPLTTSLADLLDEPKSIPQSMWFADNLYIARETPSAGDSGLIQVGEVDIAGYDTIRRVYSPDGVSPTLTTMTGGNRQPKILIDGRVRKLTPRECWRLMGFTAEQFEKVSFLSNTQLYRLAGNSIVVPVLEQIFQEIITNEGW